jgi:signal transduction histidine kinase
MNSDSGTFHFNLEENLSPAELRAIATTLLRLDHFLGSIDDLPRLLEVIVSEAEELLQAEASTLFLADPVNEDLYFEVVRGPTANCLRGERVPHEHGICSYVARERKSASVPDVSKDDRFYSGFDKDSKFATSSILASPMIRQCKLIGVLEVINKGNGEAFSDSDRLLLEAIADLAAIAIENARLLKENIRKERLAAVGQTVAGLAHYIKNVLTGMLASSSVLDHALQNNNMTMLAKAWKTLKQTNDKVATLVSEMLSFSTPHELSNEMIDICEVVRGLGEQFLSRANQLGIALTLKEEYSSLWIRGDSNTLERIIINLICNALDALEEMREREGASEREEKVTISVNRGLRDTVIIEVADNGPGIPENIRNKIWQVFFSTKGSRGSGLGLALTQKLVQDLEGKIYLAATDPEGSCFRIVFKEAQGN